jgi:hypothetical protein
VTPRADGRAGIRTTLDDDGVEAALEQVSGGGKADRARADDKGGQLRGSGVGHDDSRSLIRRTSMP